MRLVSLLADYRRENCLNLPEQNATGLAANRIWYFCSLWYGHTPEYAHNRKQFHIRADHLCLRHITQCRPYSEETPPFLFCYFQLLL